MHNYIPGMRYIIPSLLPADSSVDLVAVVSGGVGVVLLILILTIAVIVAYFYTHKLVIHGGIIDF